MPEYQNSHKRNDRNSASIEEICATTWESVYRFIYYKVQNREEAEDITQEAYLKAISSIKRGNIDPDKYMGYIKTVALNVLRDLWRKKQRRGKNVNIEAINPMENAMEDPSEAKVERMYIEHSLLELNEEQRTVIDLRILKGFSVAETAKIMNKNEVTVRVMQHRALQSLSKILKKNDWEGKLDEK